MNNSPEVNAVNNFATLKLVYQCGSNATSFTEVFRATVPADVGVPGVFAVKRFRPGNKQQRDDLIEIFRRELEALTFISSLGHERILEFFGHFRGTARGLDHFNLVFPYAEDGTLRDFLRLPKEPAWLSACCQQRLSTWKHIVYNEILGLAQALAFVHHADPQFLIHRDIKPQNILIHQNKFKLADFGLASIKDQQEPSGTEWLSGTPMYCPPEKENQDSHGRARDVWALGCVFLELAVLLRHGWGPEPAVEAFERSRNISSKHTTRAYCKTMDRVNMFIVSMEHASDFGIKSLLSVVRPMLQTIPYQRISALSASESLERCCQQIIRVDSILRPKGQTNKEYFVWV